MRRVRRTAVVAVAATAAALGGTASSEASTAPYGVYGVDTSGAVVHIDPFAQTVGPTIPVGQGTIDIAITSNRATAYVTNFFSDNVVSVDLTTAAVGGTIPVTCPGSIAIVPGQPEGYVTRGCGAGTIVPLDLSTNTSGTPIAVGPEPIDVAIAPDASTAWVATGVNSGVPSTLTPVDIASGTVGTPIELGIGKGLISVAITPDGSTAFVTSQSDHTVIPVDLASRVVGTPIAVSRRPAFLAVTPNGSTLYVTHSTQVPSGLGETTPSGVTPIDIATRTALPQIDVGLQTWGIAVSDDGTTAYVTRTGTAAEPNSPALMSIDIATNTAGPAIPLARQLAALAIGRSIPDTTAPTVELQTTPAAPTGGGGTWFNAQDLPQGTLTVTALASDEGSGVASVSCVMNGAGQTVAGDHLVIQGLGNGIHGLSCTARDNVGNVTIPPVIATYKVDTLAPTLTPTVTGSGPGGAVLLGDSAAVASPNASDGLGSGVASVSCQAPDVSSVGPHTLSCSTTDVAGNSRTVQVSYVVEYLLVGFAPPDGTTARVGQQLKISVSLADASGAPAPLCDGCAVQFQAFAVDGSGQDAGPYPMRYHNGSGEYRTSWKPSASGLGTTRIVVSVLYPGTSVRTTVEALVTIT